MFITYLTIAFCAGAISQGLLTLALTKYKIAKEENAQLTSAAVSSLYLPPVNNVGSVEEYIVNFDKYITDIDLEQFMVYFMPRSTEKVSAATIQEIFDYALRTEESSIPKLNSRLFLTYFNKPFVCSEEVPANLVDFCECAARMYLRYDAINERRKFKAKAKLLADLSELPRKD